MKLILLLVLLLALAGLFWVRLAPVDAAQWHTDPNDADDPSPGGVRATGSDAPEFAAPPDHVLQAVEEVAADWPRTRLIAGSVADGMMTFEVRSRVFGFPDYVTLRARGDRAGTRLDYVSRLRFGKGDMGVNAKRMKAWLSGIAARL